ncbi:hypothetical protein BH10PAT2_BH10PAT2_2480 [soil metagenome]
MHINKITLFIGTTLLGLIFLYLAALFSLIELHQLVLLPIKILMITAAFILSFQGIFTLFWMLYGWEDPNKMLQDEPPKVLKSPQKTFSILIPARFESEVISNTIHTMSLLKYPKQLFEVIILCKADDIDTIERANRAIKETKSTNFRVCIFNSTQTSKPSALNEGLAQSQYEIVGVFDAEDEPHVQILDFVNTIFLRDTPDIVQGGVQLMNYQTAWFSPLNVLEYYFWYKSALHLFSRMKVVPLGGNTVFFNRETLIAQGGWEECLTEDAEIGLRFSSQNKKIKIMYHPTIVTKEESPSTLTALLHQRTRWNQGFFQILLQRKWNNFGDVKRKLFAFYFLMLAQINALNFILVILSLSSFLIHLPIVATLVVLFPLYLLCLQLLAQLLGYYEFTKDFQVKFSLIICVKIILGFIPYQFILTFGAVRAFWRHLRNRNNWEKTTHQNLHRASYL